jgi:RNA polymerase sigma-70 factor (ECF subfamily)
MDSDTQRFIDCIRGGDRAALDALLAEHRQVCLTRAWRIVGNGADAEDVVQEAFLRLMRTLDAYDGSVPFGAWLGQLVQTASLNARLAAKRRRGREEKAAAPPEAPGSTADDDARLAQLRRMVEELPPELRTPIELRFFTGLSQKEAAERLGVTENAVALRIRRGKERLRRRLGEAGVAVALGDLDQRLAAAGGGALTTAAVAKGIGAGSATLLLWLALLLAAVTAVAGWSWSRSRSSPEAVSARGNATREPPTTAGRPATAPTDAVAIATASPRRVYSWDFDHGPPPASELVVIDSSWHHAPRGGRDGSGCMETDGDLCNIVFPLAKLSGPSKLSALLCPLGPASEAHGAGIGWVDGTDHLGGYHYNLQNVGAPSAFAFDPDDAKRRLAPIYEYLGEDSIDTWNANGRDSVSFNERRGTPCLSIQGRWRVDDLRLEEIDAKELPDVSAFRRAVYSVPRERRQGVTVLPGLVGFDRSRPVRVAWETTSPDAPLIAP